MVIKKIFEGVCDEEVHSDFLKFSRGEYKDRYLIDVKKQSSKWNVKTGAEFANFLVKKCLEKISEDVNVKGIIVSTLDLKDEMGFEIKKVSNFQGIRKLQVETKISPKNILGLMEKYPRVFFALSFKGEDFDLKIKAKAPKSAKPGKENEDGPKAEFCSLKTEDKSLVRELLFEVNIDSVKEVSVNHKIKIDEIVYPADMTKLSPAEIREKSKRKGIILRKLNVDGSEKISEKKFVA